MTRLLITGGAGFVGSTLALLFKEHYPETEVLALDNLSRRGSELNLPRLSANGVKFVHGDVRNSEDLQKIGQVDWLIDCSAEPSVHAGYGMSPAYLINTNLLGLVHCLEFLRQFGGKLIFLSTSRVYPIAALRELPLKPCQNRFSLKINNKIAGMTENGISEAFSLEGTRSLYGATKLCSELLIHEYCQMYGLTAIINRCGVLAGPWQMGKVDQGFMSLWVARHVFGEKLQYMGFGGEGLQVRDVLHVKDLFQLLCRQMQQVQPASSEVFNVGGGMKNSVSLRELTHIVRKISSFNCEITSDPHTREADIPFYVTDNDKVSQATGWLPEISIEQCVEDIYVWITENRAQLQNIFM